MTDVFGEGVIRTQQAMEEAKILMQITGVLLVIAFFIAQFILYNTPASGTEKQLIVTLNRFGEYWIEKVLIYFGLIFGGYRLFIMLKEDTRKLANVFRTNLKELNRITDLRDSQMRKKR